MKKWMNKEFKQMSSTLQSRFDKLDTRLAGVEKWQADQIQYFKDRAAKNRAERERRNKEWKEKKNNSNNNANQQRSSGDNRSNQPAAAEVNTRQARSSATGDVE